MSDRTQSGRWERRVYQKEAWASSQGVLDVQVPCSSKNETTPCLRARQSISHPQHPLDDMVTML